MTQFSPCISHIYQICSKICHDIAAPLSAVSLGIEILEEDTENKSHLELLKMSAKAATDKLKVIRCLFGQGSSSCEKPTLSEIKDALALVSSPQKHQVLWHVPLSTDIKGEGARLLFCCLLLALEATPRGGKIILNSDFSVSCTAPGAALSSSLLTLLSAANSREADQALPSLSPRESLGLFAVLVSQSLGVNLIYRQIHKDEFNISIR